MKKYLILTMLVVMAGLVASEVKAQPPWAPAWGKRRKQQQAYYYYPRANVYYNPVARRYYYPRNGVWLSVATPISDSLFPICRVKPFITTGRMYG